MKSSTFSRIRSEYGRASGHSQDRLERMSIVLTLRNFRRRRLTRLWGTLVIGMLLMTVVGLAV